MALVAALLAIVVAAEIVEAATVRQCGRRQHDGNQDGNSTIWSKAHRQPSLRGAAA